MTMMMMHSMSPYDINNHASRWDALAADEFGLETRMHALKQWCDGGFALAAGSDDCCCVSIFELIDIASFARLLHYCCQYRPSPPPGINIHHSCTIGSSST